MGDARYGNIVIASEARQSSVGAFSVWIASGYALAMTGQHEQVRGSIVIASREVAKQSIRGPSLSGLLRAVPSQ
ncbi:MAG: hypothetical protein LBT00_00720 [Spirochaetaceae bacterium]|nr:hypothetical protein [Spirochaetaceae bacterium]